MSFKNFSIIGLIVLLGMLVIPVTAQKGVEDGSKYGHGEDSIRCIRNLSLSREYARNKSYHDALPFWRIVYTECPKASKNIYIDGVNIMQYYIENEEDPEKQSAYVDTLMMVYDQRIQYYGQKGYVLGRKGVDLLRYKRSDIQYIEEAYGYLAESIKLLRNKVSEATLATYFTSSVALFKAGVFTESNVVEDYALVMENIDGQLNKSPNDKKLLSLQAIIEDNFVNSGAANCDALISLYTPKFKATPEDVDLLSNIVSFLEKTGCEDSDLFFEATATLHKIEPSSMSASGLASMSIEKGDFKLAYDYLKQAIDLETDNEKKADTYYSLAMVSNKLDNLAEAREFALKALEIRPEWGDPYLLIGNLYAKSLDLCPNITLPKAVFWAAVDKFQKAKSVDPSVASRANDLISTYSEYYPNKEEAFFHNIIEGSTYKVECWINENTNVRF